MMDIGLLKNLVDYGILGTLALMSFLTVWFYIERLLFFRQIDLKSYKEKEQLEIDLTNNITIISSLAPTRPILGCLGRYLVLLSHSIQWGKAAVWI
jgi:biopolymer transport protein ExbB